MGAAVYYLTKDWPADCGGTFVDLQTGREFLPEFNTLIAFRVPRMHEVTAVETLARRRFSILGWWLIPGEVSNETSASKVARRPSSAGKKRTTKAKIAKAKTASNDARRTRRVSK